MTRFSVLILLLLSYTYNNLQAQNLLCEVQVSIPKLQTNDPKVFRSLENDIAKFMNERVWSEDEFLPEERIKCNILFNITEEVGDNKFKASMIFQVSRPVYGSNYVTPIFTWQDRDIDFEYNQGQPLQFSKSGFTNNLTSVLAFYAYIIVGLDYDSFSLLGGDPYFDEARSIINTLPSSLLGSKGWRSGTTDRNRYNMIENLMNARVKPLRQAYYQYHIHGLDVMYADSEKGKTTIAKSLEQFNQVNGSYPNNAIVPILLTTKGQEVVEIFKVAAGPQKTKVFRILSALDPANVQKYSVLRF